MLKLYKHSNDGILYWEAWENQGKITIHEGTIGQEGDTRQVSLLHDYSPDQTILNESKSATEQGFREISIDDHIELVPCNINFESAP